MWRSAPRGVVLFTLMSEQRRTIRSWILPLSTAHARDLVSLLTKAQTSGVRPFCESRSKGESAWTRDFQAGARDLRDPFLILHHSQTESAAMSLRRSRVGDQIIVILFRQAFACGMNFSNDGIAPW